MKYLPFAFLLLTTLFMQGCSSTKPTLNTGTYYGTLPCADCPGIDYELQLNQDGTFREQMVYQERSVEPHVTTGKYKLSKNGVLKLQETTKGGEQSMYAIEGESLRRLNRDGSMPEAPLADYYLLTPNKPKKESTHKSPMLNPKIDFKATGNEPFWAVFIDFDNDKRIQFSTISQEEFELDLPLSEPQPMSQDKRMVYHSVSGKDEIFVEILKKPCDDTMADNSFGYTVIVRAKNAGMSEFFEASGCGEYLGDYRLNDIWALVSIDDKPIELVEGAEVPNLEINLAQQQVMGFTGCNRFHGGISFEPGHLQIGEHLAATKKLCVHVADLERAYLAALSDKSFKYTLGNNQLLLKSEGTKLLFKKVD